MPRQILLQRRSVGLRVSLQRVQPFGFRRDVDAVIDLGGGNAQARSFSVVKRGSALVSAVSVPDQSLAAQRGIKATLFSRQCQHRGFGPYRGDDRTGALVTSVGAVLPLATARVATRC